MSRPRTFEAVLLERGVASRAQLEAAAARHLGAKRPTIEILVTEQDVDEGALVAALAEYSRLPVVDPSDLSSRPDLEDLIPEQLALEHALLPLRLQDDTLYVATCDPYQFEAFDLVRARTEYRVRAEIAPPRALRAALTRQHGGEEILHDLIKNSPLDAADVELSARSESDDPSEQEGIEQLEGGSDAPVIRFLRLVVADAIRQRASDVHIEVEQGALRVRFRVDGELHDVQRLPRSVHASVLSRLKVVAGMDIIETRRPQDGRATVHFEGRTYDMRVSVIPSYFGEKAVLRILDPQAPVFDLERCGIEPAQLATWRGLLKRPNGLVLMTGPTGSGKTSTLYASLLELRDPRVNIMTVEDPVEFQFPGIVHVPVRSEIGVTFASALRSILRQDPDIVLVGEIRDAETAEVAIQAAMTGHLVLSTLHTNDAVGAIPRLLNLGVHPDYVASALLGVVAQRLVRTNCSECAVEHAYDPAVLARLGIPANHGGTTKKGLGCAACGGSGTKGRTAIVELLEISPEMRRVITEGGGEAEIRNQAAADGMRTLVNSGAQKVLAGITTPDEVLRVAGAIARAPRIQAPGETETEAEAARAAAELADTAQRELLALEHAARGEGPLCTHCHAPIEVQWKLCPHCGTAVPAERDHPSILICDDQEVQRRIVRAALKDLTPEILEADSGRSCLDVVATAKPDLLIVDQSMPGLTGIEVIRSLRSQIAWAGAPILMLTAVEAEELEAIARNAGADDYLQKPVDPSLLAQRVRMLLSNWREARAEAGVVTYRLAS